MPEGEPRTNFQAFINAVGRAIDGPVTWFKGTT